ncbi:SPOR domain-containing protein [Psychroflexus sp. CAK57W]|uniref:SPOR domain-containing protein n=1 Tax=Psychroflexus curvus TaxID=2873595 RepID=UPI001CCAE619|nr:SPOR domain-containing protein [Psychroflexus curvus]MBZ9627183.1 SPOR domain-containing protein [Psychroflexus curvus]MBZ9787177.1 SPOR domain-containing protein [Psychroflexus curvus]
MLKNIFFAIILIAIFLPANFCFAQKLNTSELQTIKELIKVKHELESNHELKSTYKLQIFSGSLDQANETQEKFESLQLDIASQIIYQTPNYKVWVGNYRNRIQADRAFEKVKSEYPNTLIIRPGK